MYDVLTIAAIADELTERIMDARVQRVGMVSRQAIVLEVYAKRQRSYLLASAENEDPRILLLEREPSFDSQLVTPLLLLLRKYVRGGIVVGIEQPPLDRILRVSIAKRIEGHNPSFSSEPEIDEVIDSEDEPDGLEGATFVHLVCEVMGRHSNIMLVDDDGRIMEAVKRVTPSMSRVRPIAPKLRYTEPPAGERGDPRRFSSADATLLIGAERNGERLASVLPKRLRGVSPQMAREIAYQATGRDETTVGELEGDQASAMARETRRILEPLFTSSWEPTIYLGQDREPIAYSAIPLDHLAARATPETVSSISRAILIASGADEAETPGKHAQRKARLRQSIRDGKVKLLTRLASLQTQMEKSASAEQLRTWGELIYAYIWAIKPRQTELEVDGITIPLDPSLSPSENAQGYFERYRKAQSAGAHLPEMIAAVETEIAFLDQLDVLAGQSDNFAEYEDVSLEWETYNAAKNNKPGAIKRRPRSTAPRRTKAIGQIKGNAIYLGRSSIENDRITFDLAGPNDTWLHARGVPGSHVIVRWANNLENEDDETLGAAASLAAYFSGNRESSSVEVDITLRRHVRKIKGAGPGMVTYRNERTISVKPRDFKPN